jgi:hypothetical protein
MTGDCHVRFCERLGVQFPRPTHRSNPWPPPCETDGRGLRIKDMRAQTAFATGGWYHVMSFEITQCHFLSVPDLSRLP